MSLRAYAYDGISRVRIVLDVLRKPAEDAFVRPDPSLLKENAIKDRLEVDLFSSVPASHLSQILSESILFPDDFTRGWIHACGQLEHFRAL